MFPAATRRHLFLLVLIGSLAAGALAAQVELRVGGGIAATRVTREFGQYTGPDKDPPFSGLGTLVEASLLVGRFSLDVRYAATRLSADVVPLSDEKFSDIEVMVGIAPTSWLIVKGGRHVQRVPTADSVQRWGLWEARIRAEARLVPGIVGAYFEVWNVLSGTAQGIESFDYGAGAEGGLTGRWPGSPLTVHIGYRIHRARASRSLAPETAEQLIVALGFVYRSER